MLDIKRIRSNPEALREAMRKRRNKGADVTELLALDEKRRELMQQVEALKARRNQVSAQIPKMKKAGEDTSAVMAEMKEVADKIKALGEESVARQLDIGVPTLRDVAAELVKPGRDVRDELPAPILRTDVLDIKDLAPGMVLTGTVRNVVDFGVFVDIGVHQDGLVHISQVCNRFIRHPSEIVSVGDVVRVVVLEADEKKHRISLSMKQLPKE